MTKDDKIKGISKTKAVDQITKVDEVSKVAGIKGADKIALRRATTIMTSAEREKFFKMIEEEADKLADEGLIPKKEKNVVSKAVKMAIDSGIIDDDE